MMSDKTEKEETSHTMCPESDDLNDLLKSALDDFDNPLPSSSEPAAELVEEKSATSSDKNLQADFETKFKNLLLADEDDATFSNKMCDLLMEVNKGIQQNDNDNNDSAENVDVMSQAINSLVENIEEIKDDEFQNNFNINDFKNDAMFPMMEQMFQMLMSKEVLYPSLMAVRDQYPTWLKDNSSKISAQEVERYTKQFNVIRKICVLFESENEQDTEEVKQSRFIEVLRLLEEMTVLGKPPSDFADSLPSMTGNNDVPDSCNTM